MSSIRKILTAALAVGALAAGGAAAAGHGRDDHARTQRGGQATQVYTLAAPEHGNPEGIAFDERSGTFFVSSVVDGTIYRGQLNDTATPVPVFVPGGTGQAATGMKVSRGRLYVAGARRGRSRSTTSQPERCWPRSTPRAPATRRRSSTTSWSRGGATSSPRTRSGRSSTT